MQLDRSNFKNFSPVAPFGKQTPTPYFFAKNDQKFSLVQNFTNCLFLTRTKRNPSLIARNTELNVYLFFEAQRRINIAISPFRHTAGTVYIYVALLMPVSFRHDPSGISGVNGYFQA